VSGKTNVRLTAAGVYVSLSHIPKYRVGGVTHSAHMHMHRVRTIAISSRPTSNLTNLTHTLETVNSFRCAQVCSACSTLQMLTKLWTLFQTSSYEARPSNTP